MIKRLSLAVTAAITLGCGNAHAASFDCRKASATDEITICDSRELSQLDVKMATLYDTIVKLVGMGVRGDMQDQQRAWLRSARRLRARPRLHQETLRVAHSRPRRRGGPHRQGRPVLRDVLCSAWNGVLCRDARRRL